MSDIWNQGRFELVINHCEDCLWHYDFCRHTEDEFVNLFNAVGNELRNTFPNCDVFGNYEKVRQMGGFDVYAIGLGPVDQRDEQGRYWIFSKSESGRFPTPQEIVDSVLVLSFLYGDSTEMEIAQREFKKMYAKFIPKPGKTMHEFPCALPDPSRVKK